MAELALKYFGAGYQLAKPMFPQRLSVKTEGSTLHIVTFQTDQKDTQIFFHFDESYPSRIPKIKVSSSTLTEGQKGDLSEFLHHKGKAEEYSNSPTLPLLLEHAGKWLQENYGKKTSESKPSKRNEIREEDWQLHASPETVAAPREITTSTARETTPPGRKAKQKNRGGSVQWQSWADSVIQSNPADDEETNSDWNVVESRSRPSKGSKEVSQVKFTLDTVPKFDVPVDSRRANYFVAIRCTNGEIGDGVTEVVKKMLSVDHVYQPICYNRNEVHVTLTTVALHSDRDINKAVAALQDAREVLINHAPTSCLTISGIDEFQGSKVVFGKVKVEEDVLLLRKVVRWAFEKKGIYPKDNFGDYHPHMTLAKVNVGFTKKTGLRNISRAVYESLLGYKFGQQGVKGIHLCQMGHDRRADGFYICPTQIDFKN
ncbi:A-kinase anchor protein 7-like [Haliotis rubra]|uniref:A-kinase anchor protein 7-like n=1 Tax=Haliotis rubra TaxID=36100 RepID=UPI001EE57D26|nr:A-kinase anchor protein 7-like [Haliotis rubra]